MNRPGHNARRATRSVWRRRAGALAVALAACAGAAAQATAADVLPPGVGAMASNPDLGTVPPNDRMRPDIVAIGVSGRGDDELIGARAIDRLLPGGDTAFELRDHGLLAPVPEPATWALWLAGMAGIVGWKLRRRRRDDVA